MGDGGGARFCVEAEVGWGFSAGEEEDDEEDEEDEDEEDTPGQGAHPPLPLLPPEWYQRGWGLGVWQGRSIGRQARRGGAGWVGRPSPLSCGCRTSAK